VFRSDEEDEVEFKPDEEGEEDEEDEDEEINEEEPNESGESEKLEQPKIKVENKNGGEVAAAPTNSGAHGPNVETREDGIKATDANKRQLKEQPPHLHPQTKHAGEVQPKKSPITKANSISACDQQAGHGTKMEPPQEHHSHASDERKITQPPVAKRTLSQQSMMTIPIAQTKAGPHISHATTALATVDSTFAPMTPFTNVYHTSLPAPLLVRPIIPISSNPYGGVPQPHISRHQLQFVAPPHFQHHISQPLYQHEIG